jgi:hypothetical protein
MNKKYKTLSSIWFSDQMLLMLLVLLLLRLFVIQPLAELGYLHSIFTGAFLSLIIFSGVLAVFRAGVGAIVVGGFAGAELIFLWARHLHFGHHLYLAEKILAFFFLGTLAYVVLTLVFREGPITIFRVEGAIVVYLLLGVMWSTVYVMIELVSPGAFRFSTPYKDIHALESKLIYFSMVTLSTVGYGDITAIHPVGRALAQLEALTGQLFPAILIARLVSMELQFSKPKK